MTGANALSPWTVVVAGPGGQEFGRYPLRHNVPLKIGRAPDCHVMLGLMTVARNHGRIELANGVPTYVDEPGASGSLVDGDPVEGSTFLGERTLLEIAGYRFSLVRARVAAPAPARASATVDPIVPEGGATLLDRHIVGLRTYRTESQIEGARRSTKWEQAWRDLIGQAREMQARYGRHPSILEFVVSKDEREVIIKLKDPSPRGYVYFVLSRTHPDGKYPDLQSVWLREVGRGDDSFSDPERGLEELVSRIAPRLV